MISLDEARLRLARATQPLASVTVDLCEASGRRLVASVRADVDLPPADVSAMDGYAVRHVDLETGRSLPVVAEVAAGEVGAPLPPASSARIFTGAPLPAGADTVVPQEKARREGDGPVDLEPVVLGAHVRLRGEVIVAGREVFPAGTWVTPQMVSAMASCGASRVEVVPRPALAVVVTGGEVTDVSKRPAPGQIRDSNGPLLASLAAASGFTIVSRTRAADTTEALRDALSEALAVSDLVLTTGGVSVGDHDLVPAVAIELGAEVLFHRVRMKPGKPLFAARVGEKLLLGLPGNPLAVLVGWRLFAWPAAAALAGDERAFREAPVEAWLVAATDTPRSRTELRPAILRNGHGGPLLELVSWRGSHDVSAAAQADVLARFEPEGSYPAGSRVPCYPLASADPGPGRRWGSSR